jgi:ABC-type glycerol-3-phosphate transport system permease component
MAPRIAFGLPFYVLFLNIQLLDTYTAMIIVYVMFNLAFAMWMIKGFFDEVPKSLEEAARMDGYSKFEAFRRVALPLVTPGIIATAIFVFIFTWNEFFYALILTNQEAKTYTVQLLAYRGTYTPKYGQLFAASTVAVVPPIIFAMAVRNKLIQGLTFGQVGE